MPAAPASSAMRAASAGSGNAARRVCRSVATWSMLTESLGPTAASLARADRFDDRPFEPCRLGFDRGQLRPFEHDAGEGLGAAVAQHEAAVAGELALDFGLR